MANIINQINVGGTTYDVGAAAANVSVDPASAGVESTALESALKEIPDNTINKYNANNLADNLTTGTAGIKALDAHQGSIIQTQTNNIMDIVYGKTTRAYAEGDFFMLNNKPYCASTTIAADTTLTDSTVMNYATLLSESATNVLAGQIAQINKTLNDKIVSNSEAISTNTNNINKNTAAISTNTNNISKNTADITALNDSLAKLYPVGSIYMSVNDTNPGTFIGGTWERLKDRFLLAAGDSYKVGTTGGEASHKLSVNEIPSHAHGVYVRVQGYGGWESFTSNNYGVMFNYDAGYHSPNYTANSAAVTTDADTTPNGGSQPHNNMPPYLAVYMWVRTA